jgi:hypothetical protein
MLHQAGQTGGCREQLWITLRDYIDKKMLASNTITHTTAADVHKFMVENIMTRLGHGQVLEALL